MSVRAALALVLVLATASPARADLDVPEDLRAARRALASYDTAAGGTARTLRSLSAIVRRTLRGPTQREARFLRAVAATDLLLIARSRRDPAIALEVARALAVAPEALPAALDAELAGLEAGVYAEVARECRFALGVLRSGAADPAALRDARGTRRDALFVSAVVDALGQPDEIARLARLGLAEECGEGCAWAAFTAEGRRAVAALEEATAALARLEHVGSSGDPFAAALAAIVAVDGAVLRTSELSPPAALPPELGTHAGSAGELARAELFVVVRPGAIEYAFAPVVRVRGGGVELVSAGEPTLPSFASIPLRDDGRAAIAPFASALEPLAALRGVARVGVTAESEVPALTVSRALVTLARAGLPAPALVARGAHGEARSLPVEILEGEEADAELALFVRLGGYTLSRGRRSVDIPRVRSASGLRFDLDALERSARAAGASRTALRYMGVVAFGTVLDAAFRLRADRGAPIRLVLY